MLREIVPVKAPKTTLLSTDLRELKDTKTFYRAACNEGLPVSNYLQPWWLDVVCGGENNWDVCLCTKSDDTIEGVLVYFKTKLKGLVSAIIMPPLTPNCGVYFYIQDAEKLKRHSLLTAKKRILDTLISQLPSVRIYAQNFHHTLTDWQPFFWKDFKSTVHYTYFLENIFDKNNIFNNFKGSVRTAIGKAQKNIEIHECEETEVFYALCEKSFIRNSEKIPLTLNLFEKLDAQLAMRFKRRMYVACDKNGHNHAAIYIVYDVDSAHYLLGGSDPELRNSGAVPLVLWHAIQEAVKAGKSVFDFEGSMIENVEFAFRNFGAQQKPFFRITKTKTNFMEALSQFFPNYR